MYFPTGGSSFEEVASDHGDDDGADVSLITGKIRTMTSHCDKVAGQSHDHNSTTAVVRRDDAMTVANFHDGTAGNVCSESVRKKAWHPPDTLSSIKFDKIHTDRCIGVFRSHADMSMVYFTVMLICLWCISQSC